jgi:phosphoglycolate phosphatase
MKYKLVIFDWDGTLMDSAGRIVSSMQSASIISEEIAPSNLAVKNIIGLSLDVAIELLFPKASALVQKSIFDHYKDQYVNHDKTPTPMFNGAEELLSSLHGTGYKLAVATGKGRHGLQRVWDMSKTEQFFHTSRCSDEAESKPSPDMLKQILGQMGLKAHEAVMIGDTEYDLGMAKAIDMDRIGVSFGVHTRERLLKHEPLGVVDTLLALRGFL